MRTRSGTPASRGRAAAVTPSWVSEARQRADIGSDIGQVLVYRTDNAISQSPPFAGPSVAVTEVDELAKHYAPVLTAIAGTSPLNSPLPSELWHVTHALNKLPPCCKSGLAPMAATNCCSATDAVHAGAGRVNSAAHTRTFRLIIFASRWSLMYQTTDGIPAPSMMRRWLLWILTIAVEALTASIQPRAERLAERYRAVRANASDWALSGTMPLRPPALPPAHRLRQRALVCEVRAHLQQFIDRDSPAIAGARAFLAPSTVPERFRISNAEASRTSCFGCSTVLQCLQFLRMSRCASTPPKWN